MTDSGHHLTMHMTGGTVQIPGTIRGVREALPEDDRARFTEEIETASAADLRTVLVRWAMNIPTEHDAAEEALVRRIRSGDFTGITFAEDLEDDDYRSAG